MAWIALTDHTEQRFSRRGLGLDRVERPLLGVGDDYLMMRGTLMIETRLSPDRGPQILFGYKTSDRSARSLMFQAIPGGGIAMVQVQGSHIAHAAVRREHAGRTDVLRIIYSWDADANWARLTLEHPEDDTVTCVPVKDARPMLLDDLKALMLGQDASVLADDVVFAALSTQIEPIGPMPSLLPDTPVATPWGYARADAMQRGDTVQTYAGVVVPVLHSLSRTVPARGSFAPVRVRAPYFGLVQDIIVAPDQKLMIDGPDVEYLFNQEAVLVPARHLVNGFAALDAPHKAPLIRYHQVLLPEHEALIAAGAPIESLYIGRLRRKPDALSASLLADFDRSGLPEHRRAAYPVLKWFEAIALATRRAA